MERFTHSLKVLWRSERLLVENELRLGAQKIQIDAMAGLVAVFGLVMLGVAFFFALAPHTGNALAALIVGGTDLLLAFGLIAYAKSLKPTAEVEMVREMRNMALNDLEDEVSQTEADLVAVKDGVQKFIRNPLETLVPGAIGSLISAFGKGIVSARR